MENSGYIGVDKRFAKAGSYGLRKHRQERHQGRFLGPKAVTKVTRQDELVHWWKMQDATASVGGAGLTEINDAAIAAGAGPDGNDCYLLDGIGDELESAEFDYNLTSAFSMSIWVKGVQEITDGAFDGTFSMGASSKGFPMLHPLSSVANFGLQWGPYSGGGHLIYHLFYVDVGGGTVLLQYVPYVVWPNSLPATFPTTISGGGTKVAFSAGAWNGANNWHNWVVTWESGVAMKSYLNGVLQATDSVTQTGTFSNKDGSTSGQLRIGRDEFEGYMSDVRIYNVALTQLECAAIYNSGDGDFV